jgi:hypothetical protein
MAKGNQQGLLKRISIKPILDNLKRSEMALKLRDGLRYFYSVIAIQVRDSCRRSASIAVLGLK